MREGNFFLAVVDRIIPPLPPKKDVYIQIPGNCECVTLQRDFAAVIKSRIDLSMKQTPERVLPYDRKALIQNLLSWEIPHEATYKAFGDVFLFIIELP